MLVIPKKELIYFAGEGYVNMSPPDLVKVLVAKGVNVNLKMTLKQVFDEVRKTYAEEVGE